MKRPRKLPNNDRHIEAMGKEDRVIYRDSKGHFMSFDAVAMGSPVSAVEHYGRSRRSKRIKVIKVKETEIPLEIVPVKGKGSKSIKEYLSRNTPSILLRDEGANNDLIFISGKDIITTSRNIRTRVPKFARFEWIENGEKRSTYVVLRSQKLTGAKIPELTKKWKSQLRNWIPSFLLLDVNGSGAGAIREDDIFVPLGFRLYF